MRAIAKSAKIHPAAKACCGWEKPAIYEKMSHICILELLDIEDTEFCFRKLEFYTIYKCKETKGNVISQGK